MLIRLTVTTVTIAMFGLGFSALVERGRSGQRAFAGQSQATCLSDKTLCGPSVVTVAR